MNNNPFTPIRPAEPTIRRTLVQTYNGKPLDDMTREELREAVVDLGQRLEKVLTEKEYGE